MQQEREARYCKVVEHRQFVAVCTYFIQLRKEKKQLPEGNFRCSAAINGRRCPIFLETAPPIKRRKKRKTQEKNCE